MQFIIFFYLLLVQHVSGELDYNALLELKKGFKEDPLKGDVLSSWDEDSFPSSGGCPQNWVGISCDGGRVTSITLNNLGLAGTFQFSSLVGLVMLQNLSISNNNFTGLIHVEVGSIGSLESLDLSQNFFHGSIPSEMMKLEKLVYLNLSSNNLRGKILPGFGELEKLKYLDLGYNSFTADIDTVLLQLKSVVYVDLSSNEFAGSLDFGLGNSTFVSTVRYLNVSHNSLVGELFPHDGMPFFDNLEVFDASHNQLVGQLPSFSFVVSLRVLRLASNKLSGSLPEALLEESSMVLSELDLSSNQLGGPLRSITSATLKNINLSSNKLSGLLPTKVGHCSIIDLSNNMFSGNLSRFQNWGNYVEVISLSSNSLTGIIPNITSQFLRLTSLKLSNNLLEGGLPSVLGLYPELTVVDLSLNKLNGSVMPSLLTSSRLTALNLSENSFTGPISLHAISESTQNLSLISLDLSKNLLTGPLPLEISKIISMVYLDLSKNNFEGSIPANLPDGLQVLNVSYNNFSGVIPNNLRRFPDSSFHPGNSLLFFLPASPPTDGIPDYGRRKHGNHISSGIRAALIAGIICGAAVITLFSLMLYYMARRRRRRNACNENVGRRGFPLSGPPHSPTSGIHKNVETSQAYLSTPKDHLPSSGVGSVHERGDSSAAGKAHTDVRISEPTREVISSPLSFLSSSSSPRFTHSHLSENPGMLRVCSPDKLAGDLHLFDGSPSFTVEELSRAPAEVIGRSCHGMLYKATLDSGHVLAVKWLKEGLAKGKKEFAREAKKLGNIRHPNIVSLRGYYWGPKEHEKLIISDYISASCLALYLYDNDSRKFLPLSVAQRLKVALDIASCLNYLHNERVIPHGNLKSTNIILQPPNLNAVLTDYSLHRIMSPAGTTEQVLNAGALGYRPPEFASSSKPCPSLKSDVYAFGVILLELITGRSAGEIVSGTPGLVDLTDWVRLLARENRATECFDRVIADVDTGEAPPRGLSDLLQIALRCILPASERPDMSTVFEDISSVVL